jgi:hypothetical protein
MSTVAEKTVHKSGQKVYPKGFPSEAAKAEDKELAAVDPKQIDDLKKMHAALSAVPLPGAAALASHVSVFLEKQAQAGHGFPCITIPFADEDALPDNHVQTIKDMGHDIEIIERPKIADEYAKRCLAAAEAAECPESLETFFAWKKSWQAGKNYSLADFVRFFKDHHNVQASAGIVSKSSAGAATS